MDNDLEEAAPPGWRPPQRPPPEPPPQRPSDEQGSPPAAEGEPPPPAARRGQHLRGNLRERLAQHPRVTKEDLAAKLRDVGRSTRASTDDDEPPPPIATPEGLEELGETLLIAASKIVNWVMRRRRSPVDWRMTPLEAASIAAPATRMLSRRMQVRSDLADATDVGRGADGMLSYVFRILGGGTIEELDSYDDAAEVSSPRHLRSVAEPARAPTPAESFASVGVDERQADVVPAVAGAAPTGGPTKEYFGGFEDV